MTAALLGFLNDLTVCSVPCYADQVGGGRFLPPPVPRSPADDAAALDALLTIEYERLAVVRAGTYDVTLLDRSVHTLLAHRFAIDQLTGLGCYEVAATTLSLSPAPIWPSLVLYLDVSQRVVEQRNRGKFPSDSIFIDARYNAAVRSYYGGLVASGDDLVVCLDGELEGSKLVDEAGTRVRNLLRRAD